MARKSTEREESDVVYARLSGERQSWEYVKSQLEPPVGKTFRVI